LSEYFCKYRSSDNDKPSSVPLTLLGVLDQQNHILKLMSLNLAVLGAVKNNAFDKQTSVKKDNLYNQSPEIQGRVTFDRKTGYWVDPTTKTLYNPYTGDRIYDNASSNTGTNSAISTGVDFKEVLKSQEKINSEISKYISTIGENQKVYKYCDHRLYKHPCHAKIGPDKAFPKIGLCQIPYNIF